MVHGHGKVILFGEHAVVFGHPALAVAIEGGMQLSWARTSGPTRLRIMPGDTDVELGSVAPPQHERLQQALRVARELYDDELELELSATASIPKGAGVGSSAALGVAVLRAMDEARGIGRPDSEIFERSFAWEAVFHGTPGGIDNYMATYGGLCLFRRNYPLKPGVPMSQQIEPTRVVPRETMRLIVADSGSRPPAIEMITKVRERRERDQAFVEQQFAAITSLLMNGKLAIEQGGLKDVGQCMDMNHMLLAGLLLVSERVEQMVQAARSAGALGAKMTGAGGGGCMIALVQNDEAHAAPVRAALAPFGTVFEVFLRSKVDEVEARGSAREQNLESKT